MFMKYKIIRKLTFVKHSLKRNFLTISLFLAVLDPKNHLQSLANKIRLSLLNGRLIYGAGFGIAACTASISFKVSSDKLISILPIFSFN